MSTSRYGADSLPEMSDMQFLDSRHIDRVMNFNMTLASELWALLDGHMRDVEQRSLDEVREQRERFVTRLMQALAPEEAPERPLRPLVEPSDGS